MAAAGGVTDNWLAAAALIVRLALPKIVPPALIDCVPAVNRVVRLVKVCTPLSPATNVYSAGSPDELGSLVVKWTVPVKLVTGLLLASSAVTVMLNAVPAVTLAGVLITKWVAVTAWGTRATPRKPSLPGAVTIMLAESKTSLQNRWCRCTNKGCPTRHRRRWSWRRG